MRLWSFNPKYLDRAGLLAVWREGLLAQKVLAGKTKGYKNHPQLLRFKAKKNPLGMINNYLFYILEEAKKRQYQFDGSKIKPNSSKIKIKVTTGQLAYEFQHLLHKLKKRDKQKFQELLSVKKIRAGRLFKVVKGEIEYWEKIK